MKKYMIGILIAVAALIAVLPRQVSAAQSAGDPKTVYGSSKAGSNVRTPKTPAISKLTNTTTGINVRWGKASYASGYHIYRKVPGAGWNMIATVRGAGKVSYTDKSVRVKSGVRYAYMVRAYNSGRMSAAGKSVWIVRMTAPTLRRPMAKGSGRVLVKWKQDKKASGYQIQYSTSSKFRGSWTKEWIRSGGTTAASLTGLHRDRTYYVRIRSYKDAGYDRHYSAWGSAQRVNVR